MMLRIIMAWAVVIYGLALRDLVVVLMGIFFIVDVLTEE